MKRAIDFGGEIHFPTDFEQLEAQLRSTLNLILLLQCLHQADGKKTMGFFLVGVAYVSTMGNGRHTNLGEVHWQHCHICHGNSEVCDVDDLSREGH